MKRIREYSGIKGQILDVSRPNTRISQNKNNSLDNAGAILLMMFLTRMNTVKVSEDSDGFYGETNDHENVNDSDLEIISSSTDGAESQREHEEDHEITATNLGVIQPQTNSLLSILKVPKASNLAR